MIDYHCHLLPAIDDGAESLDHALEMAHQLSLAGFTEVHCTPHCMKGVFDTTPALVKASVQRLQQSLDSARIRIRLRPGMEYYLDEFFLEFLQDPQPLGESRFLLFEISSRAEPDQVREGIFQILRRGLIPLLAHPERYPLLMAAPEKGGFFQKIKSCMPSFPARRSETCLPTHQSLLNSFREMGCRLQGNWGSFSGMYGQDVARTAHGILGQNLYEVFGSDGHRPEQMKRILKGIPSGTEILTGAKAVVGQ